MKKDMPLEGLRWSRDSGSALYDTPQTAVLGRAGGGMPQKGNHGFQYRARQILLPWSVPSTAYPSGTPGLRW